MKSEKIGSSVVAGDQEVAIREYRTDRVCFAGPLDGMTLEIPSQRTTTCCQGIDLSGDVRVFQKGRCMVAFSSCVDQ